MSNAPRQNERAFQTTTIGDFIFQFQKKKRKSALYLSIVIVLLTRAN